MQKQNFTLYLFSAITKSCHGQNLAKKSAFNFDTDLRISQLHARIFHMFFLFEESYNIVNLNEHGSHGYSSYCQKFIINADWKTDKTTSLEIFGS